MLFYSNLFWRVILFIGMSLIKHGIKLIFIGISFFGNIHSTPSFLLCLQVLSQFDFFWNRSTEEVSSFFLRIEIVPLGVLICIIKCIKLSSGVGLVMLLASLVIAVIITIVVSLIAGSLLEVARLALVRSTFLLKGPIRLALSRFN